jgi:hypothetical protein
MDVSGYDEWLTIDKELEESEACAEGNHAIDRHWGQCVHCGAEDESFDPDRERQSRLDEGG